MLLLKSNAYIKGLHAVFCTLPEVQIHKKEALNKRLKCKPREKAFELCFKLVSNREANVSL